MKKILSFSLLISIGLLVTECTGKRSNENAITVMAAASLTDVVSEFANDFKEETGISVRLNFASSGILARQIENGADFDYYISASKDWMDYLDSLQLVDENSINILAGNRIAAIVPVENTKLTLDSTSICEFPDLFEGRISIGDPLHVPAGKYATQIIRKYGWEDKLKRRYLPAKDVRDALFMVEMGEVEMGMVYQSDAIKSGKVRLVYEFPESSCDPIQYYGAGNRNSEQKLKKFIAYLKGNRASSIWLKNGFKLE